MCRLSGVGLGGLSPRTPGGAVYWVVVEADDGDLYRKHADDLVSLATTLVGANAAADVVASAVARTIGSASWDHVEDRYAYWVRAVVNEAKSSYRSSMRRVAREELAARREARDAVDEPEIDPVVLQAIAELSVQQRTVVFLTYWRDLPPSEVAQLLAVSEGTVRRQLARARSKLRRRLS